LKTKTATPENPNIQQKVNCKKCKAEFKIFNHFVVDESDTMLLCGKCMTRAINGPPPPFYKIWYRQFVNFFLQFTISYYVLRTLTRIYTEEEQKQWANQGMPGCRGELIKKEYLTIVNKQFEWIDNGNHALKFKAFSAIFICKKFTKGTKDIKIKDVEVRYELTTVVWGG
jgi:hypothetical protein